MASITRAEFRSLFIQERDRLFRMLARLSGNPQDAEDLLQETFLVVWRKRGEFEGRGAPEGYLRKTAHRLFLNRYQARCARPKSEVDLERVMHESDSQQPCPSTRMAQEDAARFLMVRVEECLSELPRELREAFVLFHHEGLSVREIADMTATPAKTVETRLRRATLSLAEKLRPYRSLLPAS
ncbi:MAG: RNA polymerase sigma-70 factor (ECF subfamily) [Candidatus Paceibacteria bacterium]|jgi:RNA polymerase sigma-70 factor (ECF subfamily)